MKIKNLCEDIEKEIPQMKNYHFTDQISGREISFDYSLKPGVSCRSFFIINKKVWEIKK
ncbi:hypothetical protein SAMN05660649_03224 [Desulfotomaculum arcticum]|uniref:Uncharacterized protein n=1 Tax=Desulfotruncus arcticus DSM 17038 TaxID=1121424 RepID=A0A1I2VXK9_9FIRM|nr:hypothetical protein SAMN05660649_03224 [Desulfotomaculum arcticum] [Desulfotruncus arcticus DSM 17038]